MNKVLVHPWPQPLFGEIKAGVFHWARLAYAKLETPIMSGNAVRQSDGKFATFADSDRVSVEDPAPVPYGDLGAGELFKWNEQIWQVSSQDTNSKLESRRLIDGFVMLIPGDQMVVRVHSATIVRIET